jgi:hypothetical protein
MTRTRAEHYRSLAEDARVVARSVSTEELRVALLEMASEWSHLAEQQEKESASIDGSIPTLPAAEAQPAAQQQQQVQPRDDDKKPSERSCSLRPARR